MPGNLKGEIDFGAFQRELFSFDSVTVETNTISGNSTEFFEISEDEDIVNSVDLVPKDGELPKFARIVTIRINIVSGSTNSTVRLYEDENGDAVDQTAEIQNLDIADSPETFSLSNYVGLPFANQQSENAIYLEIIEQSNTDSVYQVKVIWTTVNIPEADVSAI
jgi:hypothetical protein